MVGKVRSINEDAVKHVLYVVAEYYRIDQNAIFAGGQKVEVAAARRTVLYILSRAFGANQDTLAELAKRSQSGVAHAFRAVRRDMEKDPAYQRFVEQAIEEAFRKYNPSPVR